MTDIEDLTVAEVQGRIRLAIFAADEASKDVDGEPMQPGDTVGVEIALLTRAVELLGKLNADKDALIEAMAEKEGQPGLTLTAVRWNKLVDQRTDNYLRAHYAEQVVEAARRCLTSKGYGDVTADLIHTLQEYDKHIEWQARERL